MSLLLGIFTFVLVLVSLFMVLVILMQRAKSDGGVGAALGGGMAEAAFGGESGNVLTRATTYATVVFFVLSFGLYLGHVYVHRKARAEQLIGLPQAPAMIPAVPVEGATPPAAGVETPPNAEATPAPAPEAAPAAANPEPAAPAPAP
jgi:preprotein translocase subunit SecG